MKHIAIIRSFRASVINADNKMITGAYIDRIIWKTKIIKKHRNTADNNF